VDEDEAEDSLSEGDSKNKGLKVQRMGSGSDFFFATGEISAAGASRGG
jgi:hypothetical protein